MFQNLFYCDDIDHNASLCAWNESGSGSEIRLSGFAAPLVYAFVGTIPNVVLLSGHELRGKELFARKALQLLLIEAGVFCVSLYGVESYKRQPELFIVQAAAIFAVYFLATLISWIGSAYSASKLSRELEEFQKLCAEKE